MKVRPRLIAFFGPDGTGKSTHVELLVNFFRLRKVKVRRVWIRSPHTLAYFLSRFLVKSGHYRIVLNPFGKKMKIPAVFTGRWFRLFWSLIELASVIPLILFLVYVPLLLGYMVVAERYVVDTVVTIAYFFNNFNFLQSRTAKILLRFVPKNTVFIHLDSDYLTIVKRRSHIVEPYDFIEFQRVAYGMIGTSVGAKFIDTSDTSIKQTSSRIMKWLGIN